MRFRAAACVLILVLTSVFVACRPAAAQMTTPRVRLHTSFGDITLELNPSRSPLTVANFLAYVNSGFYDRTLFHRVIPGFIIQGGGFSSGLVRKPTRGPIFNEAVTGLSNTVGTIAMARTDDPHSATSQFFINTDDNSADLDYSPQRWGYAVFGQVVEGLDVVGRIEQVATQTVGGFQNVPVDEVLLLHARETTACAGDCNANRQVTMAEIARLVSINLGARTLTGCIPGDPDGSGDISVDEIVAAVLQPCAAP